mgnify:CR=1 FL=1
MKATQPALPKPHGAHELRKLHREEPLFVKNRCATQPIPQNFLEHCFLARSVSMQARYSRGRDLRHLRHFGLLLALTACYWFSAFAVPQVGDVRLSNPFAPYSVLGNDNCASPGHVQVFDGMHWGFIEFGENRGQRANVVKQGAGHSNWLCR